MGLLDSFCRFCTQELDRTKSQDLFDAANSRLLKTARICIPGTMSANDCYPKFACFLCVSKIYITAEFCDMGLAAYGVFDRMMESQAAVLPGPDAENRLPNMDNEVKVEYSARETSFNDAHLTMEPNEYQLVAVKELDCSDVEMKEEETDIEEEMEHPSLKETANRSANDTILRECSIILHREDTAPATQSDESTGTEELSNSEKRCENVASSKDANISKSSGLGKVHATPVERTVTGTSIFPNNLDNFFLLKHIRSYLSEKSHLNSQSCEKQLECAVCKKRFVRRRCLLQHLRLHNGEKQFQCAVCEKWFAQKAYLVNHLSRHTIEKPFKCTICKKGFARRQYQLKHERAHCEEKRFECAVCKNSFAHKSVLQKHERLHSGEKPYQCAVCQKWFGRKDHLASHSLIHTDKKPFKCAVCYRRFARKEYLKRHVRTHVDENRF